MTMTFLPVAPRHAGHFRSDSSSLWGDVGRVAPWSHSSSVIDCGEPWPADREELTIDAGPYRNRQWFSGVRTQVERLFALPPGWNGGKESRVHHSSLKRSIALLVALDYDGPAPALVPVSDGSVQLEWHIFGRVVEVSIPPSGQPEMYAAGGSSEEREAVIDVATGSGRDPLRAELQTLLAMLSRGATTGHP